ncbi:MAG: GTP-binding protein [Candidatus Woesearchaeota archaeon]
MEVEKKKNPILEQIKELEAEIAKTQYNKKTQHHIGLIKAKIAKLKEKQAARSSAGKKGEGYAVRKSGDGTVILIGFPSVGKSTLLNKLTNAESKTAAYAFTTLTCIPGIMEYKHAKIQILDVPGILEGASVGLGRGKEVLAIAQSADLVIFLVEIFHPEQVLILEKEVYNTNLRINQQKPDVTIKRTARGGMKIQSTISLTMNEQTIKGILAEFKLNNADVLLREDISPDQLIDIIEGNKKYVPGILVFNKIDMASKEQIEKVRRQYPNAIFVSGEKGTNIEQLKERIFDELKLIRIYLKEIGKKADMDIPLIMMEGNTIENVCNKLHKDFVTKFKFARVWGKSAKFPGQKLMLKHVLKDGDVLEIHLR